MADPRPDDWLDHLRARVAVLTPPPDLALTIEQRLDGTAAWHLAIAGGRVSVGEGAAPDADVTVATSRAVAAAIAAGTRSAQRAFLDGDLRIGGDIPTLLSNRDALAALGAALRAT